MVGEEVECVTAPWGGMHMNSMRQKERTVSNSINIDTWRFTGDEARNVERTKISEKIVYTAKAL